MFRKNVELGGYASSLGLEHTVVDPVPPRPGIIFINHLLNLNIFLIEFKLTLVGHFSQSFHKTR